MSSFFVHTHTHTHTQRCMLPGIWTRCSARTRSCPVPSPGVNQLVRKLTSNLPHAWSCTSTDTRSRGLHRVNCVGFVGREICWQILLLLSLCWHIFAKQSKCQCSKHHGILGVTRLSARPALLVQYLPFIYTYCCPAHRDRGRCGTKLLHRTSWISWSALTETQWWFLNRH
jgi:hypothetical protein